MKLKYLVVFLIFFASIEVKAQSIFDYSSGIDGRVSSESKFVNLSENEGSLILGTKTGIYIKNRDNYVFIDTIKEPVSFVVTPDINEDGIKDIVYAVNGVTDFYNLVSVSGKDGAILWKKKISKEGFDYSAGFVEQNESIYKIEYFNDKVYVIYDYNIEAVEYKTGNTIFKYTDKDNIWSISEIPDINKDSITDFVISNQLGEVKAIDSTNGKIIWKNLLLKELVIKKNNNPFGTVSRNIWQVKFDNNLYAIGEDGTLFNIDYNNGKTLKQLNVFAIDMDSLNKFYLDNSYMGVYPIGKRSKYFESFKFEIIDGNKAIISAFLGGSGMDDNNILNSGYPLIYMIDLDNFKELYSIKLNEMEFNVSNPIVTEKYVAIPLKIKEDKISINVYDKFTGDKVKTLDAPIYGNYTTSSITNIYTSLTNEGVLIEAKDSFSILVDFEFTKVVKNNDTYSSPNIIHNKDAELILSYKKNNKVDRIVKYSDLTTKNKAYEYNLSNDFLNDGIISISYTHDFNGDGNKDILGLVNRKNSDNQVIASYILIIDSTNGNVITFRSILLSSYYENGKKIDVYLTGNNIYAINDITGDNRPDLVIDGNIINYSKMTVSGFISSPNTNTSARMIKVGDVNSDGYEDIVTLEETVATLHTSKKNYGNIEYIKTNFSYKYDKSLMNFDLATSILDINNDGIKEIVVNAKNQNGNQYYKILSGRDLSLISNIDEEGIKSFSDRYQILDFDFDNDGIKDINKIKNWDNEFEIISGKTGKPMFNINVSPYKEDSYPEIWKEEIKEIIGFQIDTSIKTIHIGKDINGDGNKELLLLKETYYPENQITLEIYDIYNKDLSPLRTVLLNNNTRVNGDIGIYREIEEYQDMTRFISNVINTDNLFIIKPSNGNNFLYDIDENKIISGFNKSVLSVSKVGNALFGINMNNEPIVIDYSNTLKITNIKNKTSVKSPVNIKWSYEDYGGMNIVKIYDNGIYLKTSYIDNVDIELRNGKHIITLESIDRWGKILSETVELDVKKGNSSIFIYVILSLLSLFIVLLLTFGNKIRRNNVIRRLSNE